MRSPWKRGKKKRKRKRNHKKQAGKRETSSVAVNSADFVVLVIFPTRGFSSLEAGLEDGAVRKGRENANIEEGGC